MGDIFHIFTHQLDNNKFIYLFFSHLLLHVNMKLARKRSIMKIMLQLKTFRGASCFYMCVSSVPSVCWAFLAISQDDYHVKIANSQHCPPTPHVLPNL